MKNNEEIGERNGGIWNSATARWPASKAACS
jgi:hypothetical protein